jgi:hypothetical protein
LRDSLLELPESEKWISASCTDLQSVANWSAALLKVLDQHDPLKSILAVNQDFLGIYDYDSRALFVDEQAINRATIRLYWGVIGLVSQWLGCDVEDLNGRSAHSRIGTRLHTTWSRYRREAVGCAFFCKG